MGLLGIQKERFTFEKDADASTFARNRLISVVKATGKAGYSTYGSVADGCTTYVNVAANDKRVAIYPLSGMRETFFLTALTAFAKGVKLYPVADGKVVASSHTALSFGLVAEPTLVEGAVYLLTGTPTGTNWSGHGNAVATAGAAAWTFVAVSDTVNLGLTVYVTDERRAYTWNGTSWVVAKAAAVSMEAAVAGQEIIGYNLSSNGQLEVGNLPAGINYGIKLAIAGAGAGGQAANNVLDIRFATTDLYMVTVNSTTNAVYLRSAICSTAGTLILTFSADPGAWTASVFSVRA